MVSVVEMKGDVPSSPAVIWAVIIFAGIIMGAITFLQAYYIDYAALLKTPEDKLKSIEAANAIKNCFQNGKPYVTEIFLNRYNHWDIDDICGFKKPGADANVVDTERDYDWKFDSDVDEPDHSIWIPIAYQDFEIITDRDYALNKEYVIQAEWFGLGSIEANDILIEMYPSELYPGDASKIRTLVKKYENLYPEKVTEWIENIEKTGGRGVIKADFSRLAITINAGMIIPDGYKLEDCRKINKLLGHELCLRIFKGVEKIHLGRLHVRV